MFTLARRPRLLGVVLFSILIPTASFATTFVPLSLEQLAQKSDQIIHGSVLATRSHWNEPHTYIVTDVSVQVQETLYGPPSGEVVLRHLGGAVNGVRTSVAGVSGFKVGDEVVLFLRQGAGIHQVVTGLSQGRFDVIRAPGGRKVVRGIDGMGIATSKTDRAGQPVEVQELNAFKHRIRVLLGQADKEDQ